jgi:hypothetical protein
MELNLHPDPVGHTVYCLEQAADDLLDLYSEGRSLELLHEMDRIKKAIGNLDHLRRVVLATYRHEAAE